MGEMPGNDEIEPLSLLERAVLQRGNARRLKEYWKTGAGGARIRWGSPGDLTRCHRLVSAEVSATDMTSDQIWGYCNNLHKEIFGRPNQPD